MSTLPNTDELQAALGAAKRWQKEMRFAEDLGKAAEVVLAAAGRVKEAEERAKEAEVRQKDAASAAGIMEARAKNAQKRVEEAETQARDILAAAQVEAEKRVRGAKEAADGYHDKVQAEIMEKVTAHQDKMEAAEQEYAALVKERDGIKAEIDALKKKIGV